MTTTATSLLDVFLQSMSTACSQVFSGDTAVRWTVTPDEKASSAAGAPKPVWIRLALEGAHADAMIQMAPEYLALLAGTLTGQTGIAAAQLKPEHLQSVRDAFGKVCAAVSTPAAKLKFGVQPAETLSWKPAKQVTFSGTAGASKIQFQLLLSAELLKLMQPKDAAEAPVASSRQAHPPNLALIQGVELDVRLRFGSRQMPLREIAAISSGSIIELDKEVEEPAELLLGERVVARGEVVVVDGNYGLRITEVV